MVWEECTPLRSDWWECSRVETKTFLLSKYLNIKLLLSCEPLPFIFDHLPSAYLIAHNCGTTWRFWFFDSVVHTFVKDSKAHLYFYLKPYSSLQFNYIHIPNSLYQFLSAGPDIRTRQYSYPVRSTPLCWSCQILPRLVGTNLFGHSKRCRALGIKGTDQKVQTLEVDSCGLDLGPCLDQTCETGAVR